MSVLDALFNPESIAVYGASLADPDKLGSRLLANARAAQDAGQISVTAVHPKAAEFEDAHAVPSLDRPTDLALISVPAAAAPAALADAVRAGARVAVVLSSGFGEAGPRGAQLQADLVGIAGEGGTRLIGPNCMGVLSRFGNGSWLNGSYFWDVPLRAGSIAFVSQSGAFGGMFLSELDRRSLGLSRFASLGNAADVTETDVIEWLGRDPATRTIAVFSESIRDGRRFVDVTRKITVDKPVVLLKGGRSVGGTRAAMSHTGSLAGSYRTTQAALRRAGVLMPTGSDEFFDAVTAADATTGRPRGGPSVAIVTVSGGPSVLACDAAESAGLRVPVLTDRTRQRLGAVLPHFAGTSNPVDLTPQCPADGFSPAVRAVYDDPGVDGVIAINCGLDVPEFGHAVAAAAASSGKPTTAFLLDVPQVRQRIVAAGIPCFDSPERAVRGYAAWV
ncbi:acetate--CoA ligase family protein [Luedemannella helvata]|uniref:CoA-binding domain-containing protein n=1 Tax=Luedemannella helvata TaxID=349315 RepID=A0ABN2JVA7_9ACTN